MSSVIKISGHVHYCGGEEEDLPPAWHVDLSDDKASEQMEQRVHVGGADRCNLHVGGDGHSNHTCTQKNAESFTFT